MVRKSCRKRHSYIGEDDEVPLKKKCLETNLLFSYASVVVIRNPAGGIYNGVPCIKVLC